MEVQKACILLVLYSSLSFSTPSLVNSFFRHSTPRNSRIARIGRNSKLMMLGPSTASPEMSGTDSFFGLQKQVKKQEKSVEEMLKDLEKTLAEVKEMESSDYKSIISKPLFAEDDSEVDMLANDLAEEMMMDALKVTEQKDREVRAKEGGGFDIEHTFNLHEDQQNSRINPLSQSEQQAYPQQTQQQYQTGQQYQNQPNQGYQPPQQYLNQPRQEYLNPNSGRNQYQEFPKQSQGSQASPRQILENNQQPGLPNNFGVNMGQALISEPDTNEFPSTPQLSPSRQAQQDAAENGGLVEPGVIEEEEVEEEVRCINKVMQVEETVYDTRIKCQHTFTEKCHDTFITDYVPTQERKCETSFDKNCHITYKPMMFEETVKICDEPLKKICNNETVGKGEDVCKTHYETTCETRFKEHEVEQDEPVCIMVTERKCKDVRVPVPENDPTAALLRRNRRRAQTDEGSEIEETLQSLETGQDLLSVGEECEDWPVQKCTLEKKVVKKVNPETSCRKVPREICAPSNCEIQKTEKVCRDEDKQLLQNIPSEQCDLEPREDCKMETVLVPRLIQQPNCIKVPKEICVNAKSNARKVKKPVVKEWCYKPSDLRSPSTRLALSQFFSN